MKKKQIENFSNWDKHVSTYTYYENNPYSICEQNIHLDNSFIYRVRNSYVKTNANLAGQDDEFSILLLAWEYPPHLIGGLAKHVYGLAHGLQRQGCRVYVITANPGDLEVFEEDESIQVYRVESVHAEAKDFLVWINGLNMAMIQKAIELSYQYDFKVIHAHDWLVGDSAVILKSILSIPLISTIHATEFGRNNGIHTELQKHIHEKEHQLISNSDQIIICSRSMKEELMNVFTIKGTQLSIIPNGIEKVQIAKHCKALSNMPLQPNRQFILSIGRIVKEKGFDTLIEAAIRMRDTYPEVYFIIAGKGPMLDEYKKQVELLNLTDYVFFVGFITEEVKNNLLDACTMAVFPSKYEPFGIVALEAMRAGIPTIVSKVGGLTEIISHLNTGLFMLPGDAGSFIEQASFLFENEQDAKRIAQNGKSYVEKNFSWDTIALKTIKVMESIINHQKKLDHQSMLR
ncbi:glycosyltransferase involved in cell wall biosynthesis [Cytobacillus eiseniae]|uniref:Glycosyltransferase involved in cell wall biosynthesis n=1 Tax=Cytobacillus eiseniae TaxID=762947 RepID=A0ABS4RFD8_9BACI|nr:glycosyltransferase family 4 protein [Cytobacillus eiseniae]MBP2241623.1 glycosyltransferase involved in cell wall biosynthesis [Cytobacillus eiseniae]